MGLSNFTSEQDNDVDEQDINSSDRSYPQGMELIESAKAINVLSTVIKIDDNIQSIDVSVEELKKELHSHNNLDHLVDILNSWPSSKEWNSNKDYFTTVYYSNISQNTKLTSKDVYSKAGAHPAKLEWNDRYEYKIIADMYYAALLYGEDFTARQLNSKSGLTSNTMIKKKLGIKFNELKSDLSFNINQYRDHTKSDVRDILEEEFDGKETITYRAIDNRCDDISAGMITNRFGEGSLSKGLRDIGIDESQISTKSGGTGNGPLKKAKSQLEDLDYSSKADGFIYLLKCTTHSNKKVHYVGSVGKDKSLAKRIEQHIRSGGQFQANKEVNGSYKILKREEFNWDVEVISVTGIYKENMTNEEFKQHLLSIEMRKHNEACSELDTIVFGGK